MAEKPSGGTDILGLTFFFRYTMRYWVDMQNGHIFQTLQLLRLSTGNSSANAIQQKLFIVHLSSQSFGELLRMSSRSINLNSHCIIILILLSSSLSSELKIRLQRGNSAFSFTFKFHKLIFLNNWKIVYWVNTSHIRFLFISLWVARLFPLSV